MDDILCVVCGRGDLPDDLVLCNGTNCSNAKHLNCYNPPLTAIPVEGYLCHKCGGDVEAHTEPEVTNKRPQKRVKAVESASLVDFVKALLSRNKDELDKALGMVKADADQLPTPAEYFSMTDEEKPTIDHSSLIHAYLSASPKAQEIFDELKEVYTSSPNYIILSEILHVIISHNMFANTVVLSVGMAKQVVGSELSRMNTLFESGKKGASMAALLLLRTVVSVSQAICADVFEGLKRDVFNELLFSKKHISASQRREQAENATVDDLRGFAARLVFGMLKNSSTRMKEVLLSAETRFVANSFAKLSWYTKETIAEALHVLKEHVVKDRQISRKLKTNFFSRILTELALLFHRTHADDLLEFLSRLVTHHTEGVVYPEDIWAPEANLGEEEAELRGTSNKHLLHLLNPLHPWSSLKEKGLLMLVLRECPRLAPLYFAPETTLAAKIQLARPSSSWLGCMNLVNAYCKENPVPPPGPWISPNRINEYAEQLVLPTPSADQWRKCLRSESPLVRLVTFDTLFVVLSRMSQVDKRNPLVIGALQKVLSNHLPSASLLEKWTKEESRLLEANPSSKMIMASAIRCLNVLHELVPEVEVGPVWDVEPWSSWFRIPAIQQISYTARNWWSLPKAANIFELVCGQESKELRQTAIETAYALLNGTELFRAGTASCEPWELLRSLQNRDDALLLVDLVKGCLRSGGLQWQQQQAPVVAIRQHISPLLLDMSTRLENPAHVSFFCRVLRRLVHSDEVPLLVVRNWLDLVLQSSPSNYLAATRKYFEFLHQRGKVSESFKLEDDGDVTTKLANAALEDSIDADEFLEQLDESLADQAAFLLRKLDRLSSKSRGALFHLLWNAVTHERIYATEKWERLFTAADFVQVCIDSDTKEGLLCLGEMMTRSMHHETVGQVLIEKIPRGSFLLRYLNWNDVDGESVSKLIFSCLSARRFESLTSVFISVWPGVSRALPLARSFWEDARFPVLENHTLLLNPSPKVVTAFVDALVSGAPIQALEDILLYWALVGLVVDVPSKEFIDCLVSRSTSLVARMLLALLARGNASVAKYLTIPSLAEALVHVIPALASASKCSSTLRDIVAFACASGLLPSPWLAIWEPNAEKELISQHFNESNAAILAKAPTLLALSCLGARQRLQLLVPLLKTSDHGLETLWKVSSQCLMDLPHVATWDAMDPSLEFLKLAIQSKHAFALEGVCEAIADKRTDAGWVERSCRLILGLDFNTLALPGSVANVLIAMIKRRPALGTVDVYARMVTQYGASCSVSDRALLRVMDFFKTLNMDLDKVGYVWGESQKRTGVHGFGSDFVSSSMYEVGMFKETMINASLADFPIGRTFQGEDDDFGSMSAGAARTVYDPRFLLPYLRLALMKFTPNCKRFVETGLLSYALMGCSMLDEEMRKISYEVIQRFYVQVKSVGFKWKMSIEFLLSAFKSSITRPLQYVPTIISLFLARFAQILCTPDHLMYGSVNAFLLKRPFIDLKSVPMLQEAFLWKSEDHAKRWFFQTLGQGVKRPVDAKILSSGHCVELFQAFFHHVADAVERGLILNLMQRACKNRESCVMLDKQYGLLGWVSASADHGVELSQLVSLSNAIVACWGERVPESASQLGWTIGLKLLSRVASAELAESSLKLLGSCRGVAAPEEVLFKVMASARKWGSKKPGMVLRVLAATSWKSALSSKVVEQGLEFLLSGSFTSDPAACCAFAKWIGHSIFEKKSLTHLSETSRLVLKRVFRIVKLSKIESVAKDFCALACVMAHVSGVKCTDDELKDEQSVLQMAAVKL